PTRQRRIQGGGRAFVHESPLVGTPAPANGTLFLWLAPCRSLAVTLARYGLRPALAPAGTPEGPHRPAACSAAAPWERQRVGAAAPSVALGCGHDGLRARDAPGAGEERGGLRGRLARRVDAAA